MKITADGYDAHIKIADTKGTQKVFAGAVTDLCIRAIMEVTIPPEWMDRTIGEINIRKKYNINILALKKDGKLDMSITPDTQLCRDESMLVLGKYASIQKCFRL